MTGRSLPFERRGRSATLTVKDKAHVLPQAIAHFADRNSIEIEIPADDPRSRSLILLKVALCVATGYSTHLIKDMCLLLRCGGLRKYMCVEDPRPSSTLDAAQPQVPDKHVGHCAEL